MASRMHLYSGMSSQTALPSIAEFIAADYPREVAEAIHRAVEVAAELSATLPSDYRARAEDTGVTVSRMTEQGFDSMGNPLTWGGWRYWGGCDCEGATVEECVAKVVAKVEKCRELGKWWCI